MLLKKTALATFIALSLTACGSKNNDAKIDQATQNKINQSYTASQKAAQEAEENKKLAQQALSEANQIKENAQKSLNEANQAKENAQKSADDAAQAKKLAEQLLSEANATKAAAEKIIADNNSSASEKEKAAARLVETKQLIKELNKKSNDLYYLARDAGLSGYNATKFAQDYLESEISEAEKALPALVQAQKEQYKKEREAREQKINSLTQLAQQGGLDDWIASNFANMNAETSDAEAKANLAKLVEIKKLATDAGLNNIDSFVNNYLNNNYDVEAAKAEIDKRIALNQLATSAGLEGWKADNFISNYLNKDISEAKSYIEKRNTLTKLAQEAGIDTYYANNFVENYSTKDLSEAENYLAQREAFKTKAKEAGLTDNEVNSLIANYYDNNSDSNNAEQELNRIKEYKLEEAKQQEKREILAKLAKEAGLDEWKANSFVNDYAYKELSEAEDYLAKRAKLKKLATEAGLEDWKANNFVNDHDSKELSEAESQLQSIIDEGIKEKKFYGYYYQLKDVPEGVISRNQNIQEQEDFDSNGDATGQKKHTHNDIYNQKYSVIVGKYSVTPRKQYHYDGTNSWESWEKDEGYAVGGNSSYDSGTQGVETKLDKLPTEGSATYQGKAFNMNSEGDLTYNVNFSERKGSGNITGLDVGKINLEEGNLRTPYNQNAIIESSISVEGSEKLVGTYDLRFYGPNAEEIAGKAMLKEQHFSSSSCGSNLSEICSYPTGTTDVRNSAIGFGGTRGEITK